MHHVDFWESPVPTRWESDWQVRGTRVEDFQNTSSGILADQVYTNRAQVVIPPVASAIRKTKLGAYSDQGTWKGADLPHLDSQMESFVSPRVWFVHIQARCWVTAPLTVESVCQPIWPEELATTAPERYADQWPLSQEVGKQSYSAPKRQYLTWRLLCYAGGWGGIKSHPRLRVALSLSQ